MRAHRPALAAVAAGVLLLVAACSDPGSGGGEAEPTSNTSSGVAVCDPIAGDKLVVLEDVKGL